MTARTSPRRTASRREAARRARAAPFRLHGASGASPSMGRPPVRPTAYRLSRTTRRAPASPVAAIRFSWMRGSSRSQAAASYFGFMQW